MPWQMAMDPAVVHLLKPKHAVKITETTLPDEETLKLDSASSVVKITASQVQGQSTAALLEHRRHSSRQLAISNDGKNTIKVESISDSQAANIFTFFSGS